MKKVLRLMMVFLIAVAVGGAVGWFLVQSSHISVYVDFKLDTPDSTIQETQEWFKTATDSRLSLECKKETRVILRPESKEEQPLIACWGAYATDNFVQLVRYQDNLFDLAEENNLQFSSFVSGPFIAQWLD